LPFYPENNHYRSFARSDSYFAPSYRRFCRSVCSQIWALLLPLLRLVTQPLLFFHSFRCDVPPPPFSTPFRNLLLVEGSGVAIWSFPPGLPRNLIFFAHLARVSTAVFFFYFLRQSMSPSPSLWGGAETSNQSLPLTPKLLSLPHRCLPQVFSYRGRLALFFFSFFFFFGDIYFLYSSSNRSYVFFPSH